MPGVLVKDRLNLEGSVLDLDKKNHVLAFLANKSIQDAASLTYPKIIA